MVSETTPLNEWPLEDLTMLRQIFLLMPVFTRHHEKIEFAKRLLPIMEMAIKDAEERENKLPY